MTRDRCAPQHVLEATLEARAGLRLDALAPGRVAAFLADHGAQLVAGAADLDGPLRSLSSGCRAAGAPASALTHLAPAMHLAAALAGSDPVEVWVVGAATGHGAQDLSVVAGLASATPNGCRIWASDPDPVGLAALDPHLRPGVALRRVVGGPAWRGGSSGALPVEAAHLVLCRDLLRFLQPAATAPTWRRLVAALRRGGRVLVDAADPRPPDDASLEAHACGPARAYLRAPGGHADLPGGLTAAWGRLQAGDPEGALRAARSLLEQGPADPAVHLFAARAFQAAAQPHTARRHAERARALAPGAVAPVVLVAELARMVGRLDEAASEDRHARCLRAARLPGAELPYSESLRVSPVAGPRLRGVG